LKNSSGNILFLILIAVALFAALSYAVVQMTRGGSGNTITETSTINAAVLNQYTASLRASLQRMTVDNHDVTALEFNPPSAFNDLTSTNVGVFHPSGGGVIYEMGQDALLDKQSSNPTGQWVFTMNFEVKGIGTEKSSSLDGNEVIAFMVGIRKDVCEQVNKRLALPTNPLPKITSQNYSTDMITNINTYYMDNDYVLPTSENVIGAGADDTALVGKSEGCYFEASGNNYVYYDVLSER
jgi:hypothetical protein